MSRLRPGSYIDTCLLVSLFHGDSGYRAAETWLAACADQELWISHWVLLEFASATAVRLRRGDLSPSPGPRRCRARWRPSGRSAWRCWSPEGKTF